MTDIHIHSVPRFPMAAAFFAVCGIALGAISFSTEEVGFLIASIPCWTLAGCLLFARPPYFEAMLSDEGIFLQNEGQLIRYDSIDYVDLTAEYLDNGTYSKKPSPIVVTHDQGDFTIPAHLNHSSVEVFEWLSECTTPSTEFSLHADLDAFATEQRQTFADDKVFCFCARGEIKARRLGKRLTWAVAAGLGLGSAAWIAAGFHLDEDGWCGGGGFMALGAVTTALIALARGRAATYGIKDWSASGLVISPVGIAMVQGALKGRMRWDEIQKVSFGANTKAFRLSRSDATPKGILLKFDGGMLAIVDIYNHPLPHISKLIRSYWQGDTA